MKDQERHLLFDELDEERAVVLQGQHHLFHTRECNSHSRSGCASYTWHLVTVHVATHHCVFSNIWLM